MKKDNRDIISNRLIEIERLVKEFKEKFEAGTSDTDNYMTLHEIERIWAELQNNTNTIYSDLLQDMLNNVDESSLILKKKENTAKEV